jgi:phosphoribosylaminoimidazole carboxylase (NCAIR synthetase)
VEGQVVTCLKGKDSNEQTDISALQMLILHSDVITYHVEQCETSAYKEEIRKDGGIETIKDIEPNQMSFG